MVRLGAYADALGSSPLTRGKLFTGVPAADPLGLIPAHAGKTSCRCAGARPGRAHPRSRGENVNGVVALQGVEGSSPLTRGKLRPAYDQSASTGLIPAHAGKTLVCPDQAVCFQAHPRSRGENAFVGAGFSFDHGSSPLTRGKPRLPGARGRVDRLIPAHAGKTPLSTILDGDRTAHPRSRGENTWLLPRGQRARGSSPLTRGKPVRPPSSGAASLAHPRSRGENGSAASIISVRSGSSPLTRGKLISDSLSRRVSGLIPAHAGKTSGCKTVIARLPGSSPLTRGKHVAAASWPARTRLIPAHAGKTIAKASIKTHEAAHPRSRGENTS